MFHWGSSSSTDQESDAEDFDHKVLELRELIGPISGRSLQYCTDASLRRYLVARNWDVHKAKKMLENSLKWRSTYRPEEIQWDEVAPEGKTGKVYRADFQDREGRNVLIMKPGKQNTSSHENQIKHLVYLIESTIFNLPPGLEQMVWLIDFTGWSISKSVPIKTARETANILQNHYPERLCAAFLYDPPRIFGTFWKMVKYFLDPKTFQKVKFVYPKNEGSLELMKMHFDLEQLPVEFGGKRDITYDHEEFSEFMEKDDHKKAIFWGLEN
ncbi:sec14p-like phosphatidylinositol transfer family protein [Wolffia australiana]